MLWTAIFRLQTTRREVMMDSNDPPQVLLSLVLVHYQAWISFRQVQGWHTLSTSIVSVTCWRSR
jgi:hypothetical protein